MADQKGFDLLSEILDYLMAFPLQLVMLGTGDPEYHQFFREMEKRFPKKLSVTLVFEDALAHQIEAGADLFLMPSRYEPCGLNQMFRLKYGTIPVVRSTGGLADTVQEYDPKSGQGNGFTFRRANPKAFFWAIMRAIEMCRDKETWQTLMIQAMKMDFSWEHATLEYMKLYRKNKSQFSFYCYKILLMFF